MEVKQSTLQLDYKCYSIQLSEGFPMKIYSIFFLILFILNLPSYAISYSTSLAGNYSCGGAEVGTEERFTCKMTLKKTGKTYQMKSHCSDGTSYIATGLYDDRRHSLSLAFINPKEPKELGIVVANVRRDYSMRSSWTYLNQAKIGHGYCSKAK